ncbi:hypothetical protein IU500_34420 [Nocardia terpenica]|uniref:hypothetical protein n=1 Tax=Nocardia terpenica TaxID=455432 RepID=UPI001893E090|nr:hypothetical protein [Nocardia terpenica]MBF6065430.1 hypothetical protein [Nocardia terpenica]MBF6109112.1 hypothetical protein [Nocardia terpenica]MBF6114686.1 hypothetical protein [Nocardia terpenica]MBF6123371.1 hypothetical protein [Nocardia terpenica]MBF6156611.1 hypothetical protein [Nocardia terpenica]
MSENEVDQIARETTGFALRMHQFVTQLAQATSWWDKRRIRRQISLAWREEARVQEQLRALEVQGTARSLETYRRHAAEVSARSVAAGAGTEQRARDRAALVRHYNEMEERILRPGMLTPVEQGIALDGLAAATTFPEYQLGNLFGRAHKVKGVAALRYRAQVARAQAAAGIERQPAYLRSAPARPVQAVRQSGGHVQQPRTDTSEQAAAVDRIRQVQRAYADADPAGRAELEQERLKVADAAKQTGLSDDRITAEFNDAETNARYRTAIAYEYGGTRQDYARGLHASEAEAADWAARQVQGAYWGPGVDVIVTSVDRDGQRVHKVHGGPGMVVDELADWHEQVDRDRARGTARPEPAGNPERLTRAETRSQQREPSGAAVPERPPAERLADLEQQVRQLKDVVAERDDLKRKVAVLQRGVDAVTADRDNHKQQLEAVQGQVEALKNANTAQAAELKDLRAQSLRLVEVTADRDRFKSERDEAVAKLRAQSKQRDRAATRPDNTARAAGQRPPDTNGGAGGVQDELRRAEAAMEQSRAQMHARIWRANPDDPERARELIEKNDRQIADMVAAINDPDSVVVRKKMAHLNQQHGPEFSPAHAQDFRQWWTDGGDFKYRLERDRRHTELQRTNTAHTSADTQATPRETRSATTNTSVNGNGQPRPGRDGITRSR